MEGTWRHIALIVPDLRTAEGVLSIGLWVGAHRPRSWVRRRALVNPHSAKIGMVLEMEELNLVWLVFAKAGSASFVHR